MHRHSQTPRTDTKRLHKLNFSSFISQKTLRQHKLPDPCHHLICSTTLKSEARTCQLLIAAEEKTSNPTQRCSLSFCLSCLLLTTFCPPKTASFPTYLLSSRSWLPSEAFFVLASFTQITFPHHSSMRRRISSSIRRHPSPIPCQNTNTQASHANKISPCTNGTEIRRHWSTWAAEQLLSSQGQRVLCTVTHCPATTSSFIFVHYNQWIYSKFSEITLSIRTPFVVVHVC